MVFPTVVYYIKHMSEIAEGEQGFNSYLKEIILKDGQKVYIPTLKVGKMNLYHGSPNSGITLFQEGDQQTIGRGIYLTDQRDSASGYAKNRSNKEREGVVYEVEISDVEIADLRTEEAQRSFAKLFRDCLIDWRENVLPKLQGPSEGVLQIIREQRQKQVEGLLHKIDSNSFKQLRELTLNWADLTAGVLEKVGFNGLVSIEGEPPKVDFHDSYVIFQPENTMIVSEEPA